MTNAQSSSGQLQRQKNIEADNVLLKVFETGDVSTLNEIIAPDFLNHAGGNDKVGLDCLKAMVKGFHKRVPNVKMEMIRQFADDQYVSDWVRFSGSDGTVIEGMEVTRYANEKAVEHWFFVNSQKPHQKKKYQRKLHQRNLLERKHSLQLITLPSDGWGWADFSSTVEVQQ